MKQRPAKHSTKTVTPLLFLLAVVFPTHLFAASGTTAESRSRTLRETWYTITVGNDTPYGFYQEFVEKRENQIFFRTRTWKNEEGSRVEEQVGALAEDSDSLTPLFFNFHSVYRSTEITLDGNIQSGKNLTVTIRKSGASPAPIRRSIGKNVIFAQFFPEWLRRKAKDFRPGKLFSFQVIIESDLENNFAPHSGRIRIEKPDAFAQKTKTVKIHLEMDQPSDWWMNEQGEVIRILFPRSSTLVEKTSKERAESFLPGNR